MKKLFAFGVVSGGVFLAGTAFGSVVALAVIALVEEKMNEVEQDNQNLMSRFAAKRAEDIARKNGEVIYYAGH